MALVGLEEYIYFLDYVSSRYISVSITSNNGVGHVYVHIICDSTAKSGRREVVP